MRPISLVLGLLAIVSCQIIVEKFSECFNGDTCIDIRQCHQFGADQTAPNKQSESIRKDYLWRICERISFQGVYVYKVCCPSKRGIELLDLEGCGVSSEDRISGGYNARLFQFPWMALLRSRGRWICGGTLINERYVLTAAHCVRNRELDYVRLGELDLYQAIDCDALDDFCAAEPQDIAVERVIIHEEYSSRRKVNDIALLRLAKPALLNDSVVPICLPVTPAMQTVHSTFLVAGWGSTENVLFSDKLRFTLVNLMTKDECLTQLQAEAGKVHLVDTQVCAIGARALSDNCVGDSGGPLKSVSALGRFVQYGIVSYGLNSCGMKSAPGVYTRVESYVDWILRKLET